MPLSCALVCADNSCISQLCFLCQMYKWIRGNYIAMMRKQSMKLENFRPTGGYFLAPAEGCSLQLPCDVGWAVVHFFHKVNFFKQILVYVTKKRHI